MKVPFVDLRAMHEEVRPEVEAAFKDVFDRSSFVGGPYVDTFEKDFADYCGVRQVVACASGTDAVKLALMAAGVQAGDEVLTVSHTFIATVEAVTLVGARPAFIEIDPSTYHLSPSALEAFFQEECRLGPDGHWVDGSTGLRVTAVLPVHLYGMVVDIQPILALAKKYNLVVVEDSAQAHGATYTLDGQVQKAGSFGQAAAFSFYPGKNLGAMGEGGAVATNDEPAAGRMKLWRDHGSNQKYVHLSPDGWNGRLDALQCAILDIKLKKLDEWNARRRQVAAWYAERLAGDERIVLPLVPEGRQHIYHLYVVRVPQRDRVLKELGVNGVGCGLHYPIPLHLQVAYRDLGYLRGDFPVTEEIAASILTLPMFPHMTEEMVDFTCQTLKELL
jgi:dTDP-4-amino-4,6-dideoxygalactose transaminase